jgi:chromosome segregation ATPase
LTKEYKIIQASMDKLQHKYDELKSNNEALKLESRETAEELLNLEGYLDEMREEKERLEQELSQLARND